MELGDELVAEAVRPVIHAEAVDFALRRPVGTPLTKDLLLGLRGIGLGP
jgi:Arc/MetJ family transcription regulator